MYQQRLNVFNSPVEKSVAYIPTTKSQNCSFVILIKTEDKTRERELLLYLIRSLSPACLIKKKGQEKEKTKGGGGIDIILWRGRAQGNEG